MAYTHLISKAKLWEERDKALALKYVKMKLKEEACI
jgi:hypothetical protein